MADYYPLPSIVLNDLPTSTLMQDPSQSSRVSDDSEICPIHHNLHTETSYPHWKRCILEIFVTFIVYWTLVSKAPLELVTSLVRREGFRLDFHSKGGTVGECLCHSTSSPTLRILSKHRTDAISRISKGHSQVVIALHPRMPILAYVSNASTFVNFYHTGTSQHLWRTSYADGKSSSGNTELNMTPTCIRFSASDHLAIGQMDSTVVILQHHFSTLLAFASQTQQFNANRSPIKRTKIELLAPVNTILQSKLIGPITNVMFSPQVPGTDDGSSWLSIGTKYSGLWLLNLRSSQISHILNHGGIDLGCLVWSDPFQEDDGSVWASTVNSTVQATRSASSGVALQTWSRAYGDSVDAALLNDFYTLRGPTGIDGTAFRTSLSEYRPEPGSTPIHQNHRSRMSLYGSSSSVTESPHSSNEGCSLLIGGMQDGTVCLRRTFHSSSMLRTESSFTFYAGQVAQNTRFLTKSNGLVAGAITNLALLPSRSAADADGSKSCSILITIANDRSSKIHVFTVRIPPPHLSTNTSQPDDNWVVQLSNEIMNHTATVTRSLANSLLSCITSAMLDQGLGTGYWAPSKHGRVCAKYLGARLVEPMNEAAVQFSLKTSINSLSANPTGTHVLAGVAHEKNLWGGECFLLNTATISDVAVNLGIEVLHTVTPFATSGSPKRSWPEDPQGFYSRLLSPSELALRRRKTRYSINDDVNESGETGTIAAHVVFGTHECEYGQVAFGVGGKGWVVSAAVYEPTTWSSSTPAICLFALNL